MNSSCKVSCILDGCMYVWHSHRRQGESVWNAAHSYVWQNVAGTKVATEVRHWLTGWAGEGCSAEGFCWFCYRAVLQTRCSGISKPHTGLINMRSLSDRVICIYSGFQSPHRQPQSMEQLRWQDLSRWTRGHVLRCWLSFSCARIPRLSSYGVSKPLLFMEERV